MRSGSASGSYCMKIRIVVADNNYPVELVTVFLDNSNARQNTFKVELLLKHFFATKTYIWQNRSEQVSKISWGVISSHNSMKYIQCNEQKKKGQNDKQWSTKQYTEKAKINQHEHHQKPDINSVASEGYSVPAPLMAQVVLPLLHNRW